MLKLLAPVRGFSLIELMVAIAIVAVLAAIAVPSYTQFIRKGKARQAENDLVALSLNIENHYRRTLSYPDSVANKAGLISTFPGWSPAAENFAFKYEKIAAVAPEPAKRRLTATGENDLAGCTVVVDIAQNTKPVATGCY